MTPQRRPRTTKRDFKDSLTVRDFGASFNSLLMATILKAGKEDFELICVAWPEIVEEQRERYDNHGYLPIELPAKEDC